ncbi:MAG: transposase [Azospirillum sp.]|nr:transposase [Azospirillum sp.]
MLRRSAIRYRIYPTPAQETVFRQIAGACRFVYNLALEQRAKFSRRGRAIGYVAQQNELPALKAELPWLKEIPSHSLQSALRDLDRAFVNFYEGRADFPRYRRRGGSESFRLPDPKQFSIDHRAKLGDRSLPALIAPKFGKTKKDFGAIAVRLHRPLSGRVKNLTISYDGNAWYASFSIETRERRKPAHPHCESVIAIDRGVSLPFVLSTGEAFGQTTEGPREMLRLRRLQQELARKRCGSNNRRKAVRRIAAHKAKMARRRKDSLHKLTYRLAKSHGAIVLEKLSVQGMTASAAGTAAKPGRRVAQKSGLNRAILDKGWGELRRQLVYKAEWLGGQVVEVDPRFTSQTCAACGQVDARSRLDQARFACVACGHRANADTNAARNILRRGLAAIGDETTGGGLPLAACGDLAIRRSMKQEPPGASLKKVAA